MLGISVRKFLSLYEAITWDSFLRLFAIFTWIAWNWIAFFIYKYSNWCYGWGVCCRSFCSVHIFTNNCYRWSCTCEFRFWFEGYCSVCCYRISTNTWDSLGCWTIFEGCWNVIVHWHTAIAFSKFRLTCLSLTLLTCWCCWFSSWCNWGYCWCISRRSFCSVLIFTNDCYSWCSSDEWFFWYKGYGSVCCYCVSTNAVYCLGSCTIVKCCWNIIVHRHTAVTFREFRFTSLCSTLDIRCFSWCSCWGYWNNFRCISCIHLDTVWAFSLNLNRSYFTSIRFVSWCESHLASGWINCESTNFSCTISSISRCVCNLIAIFIQKCVTILFNGNSFIFAVHLNSCSCKGWSTRLSGTLDIFWSCRACRWNSCYNSWSVSCIRSDCRSLTVRICNSRSRLNCYTSCSTNKVFFRCEGNRSCSRINCICSFAGYCHTGFISRLTSSWIYQFLASYLRSLVIA